MKKNDILSHIFQQNFELVHVPYLENTNYGLYKKSNISVIVCHFTNYTSIKFIEEEAEQLRHIMNKSKINVWNTYMLISFNYEIELSEVVKIERNSNSMRRYVITKETDFNRIPFLDDISIASNPLEISTENLMKNNSQVIKIMNFIKVNNGENTKIDKEIIEENLTELFDLEV